jgi:hypothetical protein
MTAHERTGWRDEAISRRHRKFWGHDCPMVDIDFLVAEYNIGKPVAIIEYKHHEKKTINSDHPNYRALSYLADCAKIPFMVAFYWPDIWAFHVLPMNDYALKWAKQERVFTEYDFVAMLYQMRYITVGEHIKKRLNKALP